MESVILGFATIVAVIGVGALVAHLGVVDLGAPQVLSRIAFFVASPALLVTTVAQADVSDVLSRCLCRRGRSCCSRGGGGADRPENE